MIEHANSEARLPSDAFAAERQGILEALGCVIGARGAIYLATPITGGLRFIEWYEAEGNLLSGQDDYDARCREKVIRPNCETAAAFAERLRANTEKVVIDPSRFFLDHWTQPAYRTLWCEVVRQFADSIHFNEGWWTSVGCAQELLTGLKCNIPLFDGLSSVLDVECAVVRLQSGVELLRKVGAPYSELAAAVHEIEPIIGRESIR
jgi:hypothetical protein